MDYKQKFIEYYQANIHREGADRLLEWLQTTDFFTAPASTRYHCACPSGLVQHSVNVYEVMMEIEDAFPYGHGEKSVFLIERFVRLKPAEATAIRWHMGGFDDAARGGNFSISVAYDKYPIAVKLHLADLEATYLREKETSAVNH